MKFTNKYNLPTPLFDCLIHDDYEMGDADISVTGLIKPPRIRILEKRHDDEIVKDASEMLWSLLGKIGHKIIERHEPDRGFSEERLYLDIGGWKVGAKPDLWHEPHNLSDYKYTSVWAYIYGLKIEWEQQLNMYAPFYREATFPVEKLEIIAIFRDHQLRKQLTEKDYPPQCMTMPVPLWDKEKQMNFLRDRVLFHFASENLTDAGLLYCTPEERWAKPTMWAVKKKGGKRATRNFEDKEQADKFLEEKGNGYVIEERPGESTRCLYYCDVKNFCSQFKEITHENI